MNSIVTLSSLSSLRLAFATTLTNQTSEVSFDLRFFDQKKAITADSGEEFKLRKGSLKLNMGIRLANFLIDRIYERNAEFQRKKMLNEIQNAETLNSF